MKLSSCFFFFFLNFNKMMKWWQMFAIDIFSRVYIFWELTADKWIFRRVWRRDLFLKNNIRYNIVCIVMWLYKGWHLCFFYPCYIQCWWYSYSVWCFAQYTWTSYQKTFRIVSTVLCWWKHNKNLTFTTWIIFFLVLIIHPVLPSSESAIISSLRLIFIAFSYFCYE